MFTPKLALACAVALLATSCAQYINPKREKKTSAQPQNARPKEGILECMTPKPSDARAQEDAGASGMFTKVSAEEVPLSAMGGDLETLKQALKRQQAFCTDAKNLPAKGTRVGDCELSPQQYCNEMGKDFLAMAESSQSIAELAAKVKEKYDWYQLHGAKGKDDFRFTGYYSPEFQASRVKDAEYKYPVYAKPPELLSYPDPSNPVKKMWRVYDQDGKLVPYLTNQALDKEMLDQRGLVIGYLKDPTQPIDLKIEGAGTFLIREADGTVKKAFVNYSGSNGHPLRTPARVMRCMGYPRSVWGTQKKVFEFLRNNPTDFAYVRSWDPSHVFYIEENEGPFGVGPLLLYPEISLATDPNFVPTGALALYSAESSVEGKPAEEKTQVNRFALAMDVGGAIKNAHVDIFTGSGPAAFTATERFSGNGRLYVPVPRNCGAR